MSDGNPYPPPGPIRRAVCFVLGAPLLVAGGWLLVDHLLYGDHPIRRALLAAVTMIGVGGVLLVTAIRPKLDI